MVSKSHSIPLFSKSKMLFTAYCGGKSFHFFFLSLGRKGFPPQIVVGSFHFFISGLKSKSLLKILVAVFSFELIDEGNYNRIKKAFQNKLNTSADQQTC